MADGWIALAHLTASVLTLAPMSLGLGWANAVAAGVAGPPPPHPDLAVLGLQRLPASRDALRKAYRAAARAAHPDAPGGSQQAFLAVAGAFERLSSHGAPPGRRTP